MLGSYEVGSAPLGAAVETSAGGFSVSAAGGIASGEAFGTAVLSFSVSFSVTGAGAIASGEAFGTAVLSFTGPFSVTGAGGIASTNAFGTATASFTTGGTLLFQAAGMEFGRRTGLGISTFSLDAGASYRYTVHADALTLGSAIITSAAITLDSAGKLPNLVSASLTQGTTYRVVAIRQSDGEAATFRMVAA